MMIWFVAIGIALVIGAVVIFVASRSPVFHIERSITVEAPATDVFMEIDDLHRWPAWSPWAKMDPSMKTTYASVTKDEGATYDWAGNQKVGAGRMTILKSQPLELVELRLEFLKPFRATNIVKFRLVPMNNCTKITWSMDGPKNFIFKAVHLVMNIDRVVGKDFEAGLSNLKRVVETPSAPGVPAQPL